ncbi:hypothetical protein L7F22_032777 [Adiantum nelumboides]|nr:hypothetical protein [Adiantum nelumboides]
MGCVCGCPGRDNDAAHWKASAIYKSFRANRILQEPVLQLHGVRVLPYLLADSGYGACRHLIKPYAGHHPPSGNWRSFNCHLSKGRVRIEHVFGMLKNRWRILRDINVDLPKVPQYIVACCVLHNICCMDSGGEDLGDDDIDPHPNTNNNIHNVTGAERLQGQALKDAVFREWNQRVQVA